MIFLGLAEAEKISAIERYMQGRDINKVVILSPERFEFDWSPPEAEWLEWSQIIEYKPFYRLLQEIDRRTLVVINECLRKQNRSDLTYNCIRHYLNQTGHQVVFQYLPIIDGREDFMILFDFDTESRWRRTRFDHVDLTGSEIRAQAVTPKLTRVIEPTTEPERRAYERKKANLFDGLGAKDPHTLPRNLYLQTGKTRLRRIDPGKRYAGRNNRFKLENLTTYREAGPEPIHGVFELPHNHIDFNDFLAVTRARELDVLSTDLPVDQFYWDRYQSWIKELGYVYAAIQQNQECS